MKKVLVVLMFPCLMGSTAVAGEYEDRMETFFVQSGFYMPSKDFNDFDSDWGGYMALDGVFFLNDYFGLGSYLYGSSYDTEERGNIEYTLRSFIIGASAVGRLPLENFDLYALGGLGIAFNYATFEQKTNGFSAVSSADDWGLSFRGELGARYYLRESFSLGASLGYLYNKIEIEYTAGDKDEKLSGFYIGVNAGWSR